MYKGRTIFIFGYYIVIFLCDVTECHKEKMSSIPQGAYAAWKVRINEDKIQVPDTNNMLSAKRKDSEKSTPQQPHYLHVYEKCKDFTLFTAGHNF
jgi:hypothetical protein